MVKCICCLTTVTLNKPTISCEVCKNHADTGCISKSVDILLLINTVPGLSWKGEQARGNCISVYQTSIQEFIEVKVSESVRQIHN